MKRIARILPVFIMIMMLASSGSFAATYDYQITFLSGNQGVFKDGKTEITIEKKYGEWISIDVNSLDVRLKNDKYFVKGLKMAGTDSDSSEIIQSMTMKVEEDQSYIVTYGLKKDMVKYTVSYLDQEGHKLLDDDTYYGVVGDKPTVSFKYVAGYVPEAYNEKKTLAKNESQNVFKFYYEKDAEEGGESTAPAADSKTEDKESDNSSKDNGKTESTEQAGNNKDNTTTESTEKSDSSNDSGKTVNNESSDNNKENAKTEKSENNNDNGKTGQTDNNKNTGKNGNKSGKDSNTDKQKDTDIGNGSVSGDSISNSDNSGADGRQNGAAVQNNAAPADQAANQAAAIDNADNDNDADNDGNNGQGDGDSNKKPKKLVDLDDNETPLASGDRNKNKAGFLAQNWILITSAAVVLGALVLAVFLKRKKKTNAEE